MLIFRIFGAGEWGLAVANHLSLNNNVEIYLRDKEKIELYKQQMADKGLGFTFNDNISFNLGVASTIFSFTLSSELIVP